MTDIASPLRDAKPATGALRFAGLLRSSGLVLGARFAGVGLGLFMQVLLARLMAPSDLGLFFMAMSVMMVLSIVHTLGYPMIVPRIVVDALRDRTPGALAAFMGRARRDLLAISAVVSALALAGVWLWPDLDHAARLCLSAGIAAAPFMAVMRLNGSLANAMRRFSLGFVPDLVVRPLLLVALIAILWFVAPQFGVAAVVIGHVPIVIGLTVWQAARIRRHLVSQGLAAPDPKPASGNPWPMRRQAGSMLVAMLFTGVVADLVLIFSGAMMDSHDVGVFGVCLKIAMIAAFAVQTVQQIAVRDTAEAVRSGDRAMLALVLGRANGLGVGLALAGLAGTVLFGRFVLSIFGDAFVDGYACLVILMAAQLLRALAGPALQMLALVGQERISIPVFGASLAMLAVANAALTPAFGIEGAAVAFLVVMGGWPFVLSWIVRARTGIDPIFGLGQLRAITGRA